MRTDRRITILKIAAAAVVGLLIVDWAILGPAITRWKSQTERIAELQEKVKQGRQLLERERSIRDRWSDMLRSDLPDDLSAAENDVFKAIGRWARESRVSFSSLTPQWRPHEDGYETLEWRAIANGDQASLGRLIYEIEMDPLAANLEECEIAARDAQGKQLTLTARFSFIRLTGAGRNGR